ncbi:MAG: CHAD domain-containing protein [Candidatus Limnocylindrales bacterium]
MWPHVERMFAREGPLRDPAEKDALKRYRVATRRLRAALRVFRDAYSKREVKLIRTELAELARVVGAVRDLDVRIGALIEWAALVAMPLPATDATVAKKPRPDRKLLASTLASLEPLRAAWAAERAAGASVLAQRLDGKKHRRLLAELASFVAADDAPRSTDGAPERAVQDRVASSIWAAYELVRAYAPVMRGADLPTIHGLRVEAKRLRYTIEFLGDLIGPERTSLIERLVALQDHLGSLNDAALTVDAVHAFLADRGATLAPQERVTIERYLGDRAGEVALLRRSIGRSWRPVVAITFAGRLARAVVVRPRSEVQPTS